MSYRSLYRKWRPLNFRQIVGQEHITRTLQNALVRENISHAYLFCGPRGTGKTTAAKILARAVNCLNITSAEPCGECKLCHQILSGASMDVLELDAASNRGIDEVRDLREKTRYVAAEGKYKVYIIDEVHMLTNEAFNALLKTLEEPPPGVIFILATTEPSKLPPTVISRCQRLDFRLLRVSEVNDRIREVANKEGWVFEEEALLLIAQISEGAMRDALGLLEQVYALGEGRVMAENVYILAGLAREETVERVVEALAGEDIVAGLSAVREVAFGGKDLYLFLKEQMFFFKQLLVFQSGGMDETEDSRYKKYLIKYRDIFSQDCLLDIISLLHRATGEIRFSEHANFILEITFLNMLKAAKNDRQIPIENLVRRLDGLERRLDQKNDIETVLSEEQETGSGNIGVKGSYLETESKEDHLTEKGTEDGANTEITTGTAASIYSGIIELFMKNKKQASIQALLQMVQPEGLEDDCLILSYEQKNKFLKDKITEAGRLKLIEKIAGKAAGRDIRVRLVARDNEEGNKEDVNPGTDEFPAGKKKEDLKSDRTMSSNKVVDDKNEDIDNRKEASVSPSSDRGNYIFNEAIKLFEGKILENDS